MGYEKLTNKLFVGKLRFAVNDSIDVKGLKAGYGSRACYGLYPVEGDSASGVKRLLIAGVVSVGKVKTSQFADREELTTEWFVFALYILRSIF